MCSYLLFTKQEGISVLIRWLKFSTPVFTAGWIFTVPISDVRFKESTSIKSNLPIERCTLKIVRDMVANFIEHKSIEFEHTYENILICGRNIIINSLSETVK